jgi:hypothetical protein
VPLGGEIDDRGEGGAVSHTEGGTSTGPDRKPAPNSTRGCAAVAPCRVEIGALSGRDEAPGLPGAS